MDTTNIIIGSVSARGYTVTAPIVKEDYGIYLKIEGVELPTSYEVDFSNDEKNGTSVTMIGNADGVLIPSQFIGTGKDIFAFLYHVGEDFGRTVYKFRIPNKVRPDRTDEEPTPEEQSVIDQTISALNEAVAQTAQDVIDADASAQASAESAQASGESALSASNSALSSGEYASNALGYAESASASATASANSASASAQIKADVEELVDDAQGYAESASQSATASANSATTAQGYAQGASSSAQSASDYASQAQTSANTASAKAQDASQSATTASQKATESAQSASRALGYKTDAESAKVASQTAQGLAESARDSAISAKTDAEQAKADAESARDEAQSAVASISGALADKAPIITDTASGAIASFSDGADDLPLKSLIVDINPVQDLHGQDAPYPAGGGVNKFKYNVSVGTQIINGVTWTLYEDGSIQVSGTASGASTFRYVLSERVEDDDFYFSGNYKFYAFPANISTADFQGGIKIGSKWYSVYADGYSRALNDADGKIVEAWFQVRADKTVNATIRPMIYPESESTPTAWSPYANICPISGWTEVNVEQSGKNLFDSATVFASLGFTHEDDGSWSRENIAGISNAQVWKNPGFVSQISIRFTAKYASDTSTGIRFKFKYTDGTFGNLYLTPSLTYQNYTFVSNPDRVVSAVLIDYGSNNIKTWFKDVQFEASSTATPYSPYTGRSLTINLGQTIYGGKLDVLTGELVIDRAMVDLATVWWSAYDTTNKRWNTQIQAMKSTTARSDKLWSDRWRTSRQATAGDEGVIFGYLNYVYFYTSDTNNTPIGQLMYELATPITIQLTPNQINSLYGVNNLWADSGDTEVVYRADTKLYIERLTAPDSADMIADANITSGKYFMVGNSLYKATANIANGSAIVVGTNCIRKSLSEALNEINA